MSKTPRYPSRRRAMRRRSRIGSGGRIGQPGQIPSRLMELGGFHKALGQARWGSLSISRFGPPTTSYMWRSRPAKCKWPARSKRRLGRVLGLHKFFSKNFDFFLDRSCQRIYLQIQSLQPRSQGRPSGGAPVGRMLFGSGDWTIASLRSPGTEKGGPVAAGLIWLQAFCG